MSLVESGLTKRQGVFDFPARVLGRLKDIFPIGNRRKEQELSVLVRPTVSRLLENIQVGGFSVVNSMSEDTNKSYWVELKHADGGKYSVLLTHRPAADYHGETVYLNAREKEFSPDDAKCEFSISMNSSFGGPAVPILSPDWKGSNYLDIKKLHRVAGEEPSFTIDEKIAFLLKLLSAEIDEEETQLEYDLEKRDRFRSVTWVREEPTPIFVSLLSSPDTR